MNRYSIQGFPSFDTWLKPVFVIVLTEFKELFGSFTSHRDANRTIGMQYGSTGSAK
ncbi:hypothetical protein HanRHA438_Chr01g0036471 [Helianthus annuus]|nr:hypothetical protein HanRHA438_Chr01g0036471 [Helianthus annuus]